MNRFTQNIFTLLKANFKKAATHISDKMPMIKASAPPIKQFILPFTVLTDDKKESFSNEVEAATIYALSEMERAKGGGLIMRRQEKILFITKLCYPLWLLPRAETTYVFDGLNQSRYVFQFFEMPNVKNFQDDLEGSSRTRETYMEFLSSHAYYFQQAAIKKELTLEGLIANQTFFAELETYRKEATEITSQPTNSALLFPIVEESKISALIDEMDNLRSSFKGETERLQECIKQVNNTTSHYVSELRFEAEAVKEESDAKIKALQELINPKIASLNHEYNNLIVKLTKSFESESLPLQKQNAKLKKEIVSAKAKVEQYKKEVKKQAEKYNTYSEKKLKQKLFQLKKELSGFEKQFKQTEKTLKDLEQRKSLEIFRLKSELEAKIKKERMPILELEASCNEKIQVFNKETEQLEKKAKTLLDELAKTAKLREAIIAGFEPLGIKQDTKLKTAALFYIPFYVACYQTNINKRYFFVPPSIVGSVGLSAKLKGALGMNKMKELLTPRFKAIASLTDKIQAEAKQNSKFEDEMELLCRKTDLLSNSQSRESIKRGLDYLMHEGWISERALSDFNEKID
jgi:hypothetical protein